MAEVILVKFRFKNNNQDIWLDWCNELKNRKDEVIKTLKNEGVISESCFLSKDEKCIYYFMEVQNFDKVKKALEKSNFKIDKEHKIKKELALERVEELKELFHFENRD